MSKENNSQTQGVPVAQVHEKATAWLTPGMDLHLDNPHGYADWIPLYQRSCPALAFKQAQPVEAEQTSAVGAEPREVQHIVKKQGSVLCNDAYTRYESGKCLIVEMDLRSKYCELVASSGHGCFIGATERSLHLDGSQPRDANTWIEFDLPGGRWVFVTGSVSRYTLTCVFLRDAVSDVPRLVMQPAQPVEAE